MSKTYTVQLNQASNIENNSTDSKSKEYNDSAKELKKETRVSTRKMFEKSNNTLQGLFDTYEKLREKYCEAIDFNEKQKTKIELLNKEIEECKTSIENLRVEKNDISRNLVMQENKTAVLSSELQKKETIIKEKDNVIQELNNDLGGRNQMIGIMNKDQNKSLEEYQNKLAGKLESIFESFKEFDSFEMNEEIGLAYKALLGQVFSNLEDLGVSLGQ